MNFSRKKLPKEAADKLRVLPVASIRPCAMMPAPVYAFMQLNEKFVALRGPLDFFTAEDLAKFQSLGNFYLSEFVDTVKPFRETARKVLFLLSWDPELNWRKNPSTPMVLAPSTYEISDAVLRMIGPLWSGAGEIEPFFVAIFVDELCGALPQELLISARERSMDSYEAAVFGSSWAVFLALHLGYCEAGFLARLRQQIFSDIAQGKIPADDFSPIGELLKVAHESFGTGTRAFKAEQFALMNDRASQKIRARLQRVKESGIVQSDAKPFTIYGEGGFVDA